MSTASSYVDKKELVVTDKTALPPRCFKTNQPVSEAEYTTWDLPYIPRWLVVVMLISPLLLIFVPFGVRRRCHLRAGLSQGVRTRFLLLKLAAGVLILLALFCPFFMLFTGQTDQAVMYAMLFPFLFWGGFAILILFTSPLRVVRHREGSYWIKGCSQEFLNGLQVAASGID